MNSACTLAEHELCPCFIPSIRDQSIPWCGADVKSGLRNEKCSHAYALRLPGSFFIIQRSDSWLQQRWSALARYIICLGSAVSKVRFCSHCITFPCSQRAILADRSHVLWLLAQSREPGARHIVSRGAGEILKSASIGIDASLPYRYFSHSLLVSTIFMMIDTHTQTHTLFISSQSILIPDVLCLFSAVNKSETNTRISFVLYI